MKIFFAALTLLLITTGASASELSCSRQDISEIKLMKQAPHGASRSGKHTLTVGYARGSRTFTDKPPHEELGGTHWRYCGYDKKLGVHLIGKSVNDLFTGTVLFDKSGITVAAGHTVLFSPDRKRLLAIEQTNGVDGESWSLIDISGKKLRNGYASRLDIPAKKLWSGYAGIMRQADPNGDSQIEAQFENPRWGKDADLTADFVCADGSGVKGAITLKSAAGGWQWLPDYKCDAN